MWLTCVQRHLRFLFSNENVFKFSYSYSLKHIWAGFFDTLHLIWTVRLEVITGSNLNLDFYEKKMILLLLIIYIFVQARRSKCELYGYFHRAHGPLLHGGPPKQQTKTWAGVGGLVCIWGGAKLHQHCIQGGKQEEEQVSRQTSLWPQPGPIERSCQWIQFGLHQRLNGDGPWSKEPRLYHHPGPHEPHRCGLLANGLGAGICRHSYALPVCI